jgi:murein L,D-transpeptidase YafK
MRNTRSFKGLVFALLLALLAAAAWFAMRSVRYHRPIDPQGTSARPSAETLAPAARAAVTATQSPTCPPNRNLVVVTAAAHTLSLCEHGALVREYDIRLGKNGLGKTREGDGKTPLGEYPLAAARSSQQFGKFALIGYPTPAQRAQGATGGAIGVHGPHRKVRFLGALVNAIDSTDGCIGLAKDAEIDAFAEWLAAHPGTRIDIRE